MGLRERKKQERRDTILACGSRLFEECGFETTRVEAIAECADISLATFYNFFPGKIDLLTELLGRQVEERLSKAVADLDDQASDSFSTFFQLVELLFHTFDGFDRGQIRLVTLNAVNEGPDVEAGSRYSQIETHIIDHIETALLRMERAAGRPFQMAVDDVARAIFSAGNGEYYLWIADPTLPVEVVLSRIRSHITLILRGAQG